MVVSLQGPLGVGKTTLVRGIAQAIGIKDDITSPSFTIISMYRGKIDLYHMDLYRIGSEDELIDLGLEDMFYGDGISVIEWGERAVSLLPDDHVCVKMAFVGIAGREISIRGLTV